MYEIMLNLICLRKMDIFSVDILWGKSESSFFTNCNKYWQLKNVIFGASLGFPDIFSWETDCEDWWRGENS